MTAGEPDTIGGARTSALIEDRARDWVSALPTDWIVPFWPVPAGVQALMTTRRDALAGGERLGQAVIPSQAAAAGLGAFNLGLNVADDPEAVRVRRGLLAALIGAPIFFMHQTHGIGVANAGEPAQPADAVWTDSPEMACAVSVADCLGVLFCLDAPGLAIPIVAAAHAGWRGLSGIGHAQGVLEAVVERLLRQYQTSVCKFPQFDAINIVANHLHAWLGPCIGPDEFEVGSEVRHAFVSRCAADAEYFVPSGPKSPTGGASDGTCLCNLSGLAVARLRRLGLRSIWGNDGSRDWCTASNPERFYSHRASSGQAGRMAAIVRSR